MNIFGKRFYILVAMMWLLAGCGTTVHVSKKNEEFSGKISNVAVIWNDPVEMKTEISKMEYGPVWTMPVISESDRAMSRRAVAELLTVIKTNAEHEVGAKLTLAGVTVMPRHPTGRNLVPPGTKAVLFLKPVFAWARCGVKACLPIVAMEATLMDQETTKRIWFGGLKVTPASAPGIDKVVVEGFADSIISELKENLLL